MKSKLVLLAPFFRITGRGVHLHEKSENFEWLKIMTSNLGYYICISINNLRSRNSGLKISKRVGESSIKEYGESEEEKQ
jgi:hypothetical protein